MTKDATRRGSRRILRLLAWGLLLIAVTSPLWVNLLLATPLATGPAARAIGKRLGLECQIRRLSLWPWKGLTVHGLCVLTPEELRDDASPSLLEVREIRIDPDWSALFGGKWKADAVTVVEPRIDLPLEILLAMIPETTPTTTTPALAMNTPELAPIPTTPSTATTPPQQVQPAPGPASPSQDPAHPPAQDPAHPTTGDPHTPPSGPTHPPANQTSSPPPHQNPTQAPAAAPHKTNPPPAAEPPPTRWCHIEKASLRLRSTTHPAFHLELEDLTGSIPLAGRSAQSRLHLQRAGQSGQTWLQDSEFQINWDGREMVIESGELELGGLKTKIQARLQTRPEIPFRISVLSPLQDFKEPVLLPKGVLARFGMAGYRLQIDGWLLTPGSWNGYLLGGVKQAGLMLSPHTASFDEGSALLHLMPGGHLICHRAELRDDNATLMAQGHVFRNGSFVGSLRLVTDPQQAAGIAQSLFPELKQPPPLTPLSTPQRCAFDLEAIGKPGQIQVRVGHQGPVLHYPAPADPQDP